MLFIAGDTLLQTACFLLLQAMSSTEEQCVAKHSHTWILSVSRGLHKVDIELQTEILALRERKNA